MAEAMTGKEFREYVESGGRVFLSPSYGGYYWLIEWTNKTEMLKLAQLYEDAQKAYESDRSKGGLNTNKSDHILFVEYVSESHLDPDPVDEEEDGINPKSILTLNLSFE